MFNFPENAKTLEHPVCDILFGSRLYGTATETSDTDIKGIYIPTVSDVILGKDKKHISYSTGGHHEKNSPDDVDFQKFSLLQFIEMGIKGETVVLDMIHADENFTNVNPKYAHIWKFIRDNRHKFYTINMKSYMGYVNKQAAVYGVKGSRIACLRELIKFMEVYRLNGYIKFADYIELLPESKYCFHHVDKLDNLYYEVLGVKYQSTISGNAFENGIKKQLSRYGHRALAAEQNEGIDWKTIHHALRAGFQLLEIYDKNDLRYPLEKKDFLIDVKQGKMNFSEVKLILEDLIQCVDDAASKNKFNLPIEVDKEFWYNFVLKTYKEIWKEELK